MNFTGGGKKRSAAINITSLIDVMFLLVIFVLLAAKFEPDGGIAVNLPQGESKEQSKPEIQVLTITADGKLYMQKDPIPMERLASAIKDMRGKFKDPVLVINADKAVPYGTIARAMDIVKSSEQTKFYFKTKQ